MAQHAHPPLTWNDVDRWAEFGLISAEQLEALKRYSESVGHRAAPTNRFNLITIACYFGAFMVLLAYTLFMGMQWETLGTAGQLGIAVGSAAGLVGLGAVLRRKQARLAGNLLLFAAVGITPLIVYTIQNALGFWPQSASLAYRDFYHLIRWQWLGMEVVSIIVGLIAVWCIRFPLFMLLVAFWSWYLSMDITRLIMGTSDWLWELPERVVGLMVGLALVGIGVALQGRRKQDYSFWLYFFGNLLLYTHLSALALDEGGWFGLALLVISLGAVVASVALQRRVFLVFGALGCYTYVGYLAFNVFADTLGFPIVLAAVGVFTVVSAVAVQHVLRRWQAQTIVTA